MIRDLAAYNNVTERVHVETAMASGVILSGAAVGVVADDSRWATTLARPSGAARRLYPCQRSCQSTASTGWAC